MQLKVIDWSWRRLTPCCRSPSACASPAARDAASNNISFPGGRRHGGCSAPRWWPPPSLPTRRTLSPISCAGGVSTNWLWWAFLITGMLTVFFYASRHFRDAADRSGDLAGLLRQDQSGSLWLARRCRYRRGGSSARQRVRRAHRLVPRLCRCLRVAVRDRLPYLRPLPIWVRLPWRLL